jgi:chemotaxis protein CheD
MLPSHRTKDATLVSEEARYGIHAMELLINDLLRNGANRALLRAKVFGGSTMIKLGKPSTFDVPKMNIRFAFEFLDTERIPVDSYSVGGGSPRRIYFFPRTAKVLQRFTERGESAIGKRDERYSTQLQESFAAGGKPTLFI